jgi:DNA-directed RNA polymerase specialized sigma24 family protein
MKELGDALGRLDDQSRALLDLSLRRGMADDEIGAVLRVDATEVAERRDELVARLASELKLEGREEHDELLATLPDLPDGLWRRHD